MKIILDAYGGDNAPLEPLKGAALAVKEYGVEIILSGKEEELCKIAAEEGISLEGIEIAPAPQVMPVEVDPTEVLKSYNDSSLAVGLRWLAEGKGEAFVTAGSTGAAVVGSSLIVKRLRGIKRAALAIAIPTVKGPYLLIDGGANVECRPEMLAQFGIMGSAYMERVMEVPQPRVGVVNIGTEENKGLELQQEAVALLRNAPVNLIGYVEARDLPLGGCDVAVCDGFTGNVILKLTEGMGKWISLELKNILLKNVGTKLAAVLIKDGVQSFRKQMDYTEYGGAPLLGISRPVIKAHGSSNANAFKNAIRQAKLMVENEMIATVTQALTALKESKEEEHG